MNKCRLAVMIVVILTLMSSLYGCSSQGLDGIDGLKGDKGDKGDQGDAGPQVSPVIFNVDTTAQNTIATVSWNTTQYATSQLEYGQTTAYGTLTELSSILTADHIVDLSGLSMDTTYHFRVRSKNEAGDEGISKDYTLSTGSQVYFAQRNHDVSEFYYKNQGDASMTMVFETDLYNAYIFPSPDRTRIAVTGGFSDNKEIYVMNIDGSDSAQLTDNDVSDDNPLWSQDGTMIMFTSSGGSYKEIWMMNADGSSHIQLTDPVTLAVPYTTMTWFPDSTRVVFSGANIVDTVGMEIWVIDADGTNLTQLTDNDANNSTPVCSPDGSKIAYISNESGSNELWVMNADGSSPTQLTDNDGYEDGPAWSFDGTKIAFISDQSGNNEIWVMDADGSNLAQLTDISLYDYSSTYQLLWSPDGTRIMFVGGYEPEIWMMNADGTDQVFFADGQNPVWAP